MSTRKLTAKAKAKANPTKNFFVHMLTRDISLEDCIFDLIDNSIDGAWNQAGDDPLSFSVSDTLASQRLVLSISEDRFEIVDNSGGITLDNAINYAFTFGRSPKQAKDEYSVGVYGIGMKRALFKLGQSIDVHSTYRAGDHLDSFAVPINVAAWVAMEESEPWDFDLFDAEPASEPGVRIQVSELTDETRLRFADPTYALRLVEQLSTEYMIPLMRGLQIEVNGLRVRGRSFSLAEGAGFAPQRISYRDEGVDVEIIAGMASSPPEDDGPTDSHAADPSGWYVVCNGRVVLATDRTYRTGWGVNFNQWHRQYSGFVGLIHFTSEDPLLLPMTTTKRNIDSSSLLYRRALGRVATTTRSWITYTNGRKNDLVGSRTREQSTEAIELASIPVREKLELPLRTKAEPVERLASVSYSVPLTRMRALADAMGNVNSTYREVGQRAFDFAFDELVDDK